MRDAERVAVPAGAAGVPAEGQMTILERAERVSVSLDAHDRAGMPIPSSGRKTKRTTDKAIGAAAWIEHQLSLVRL